MPPLQVRFKDRNIVALMHPQLARGLWILCTIIHGETGKIPVVTSIWDGHHSENSLHFIGCAADVRSKNLNGDEKHRVLHKTISRLGTDYDLILEAEGEANEHYHLEWDQGKFDRSRSIHEAFGWKGTV